MKEDIKNQSIYRIDGDVSNIMLRVGKMATPLEEKCGANFGQRFVVGEWKTLCDHTIDKYGTNITREYLANTYGKVESKEHAEFVAGLAVNIGIPFTTGMNESHPCWFAFDEELYFFNSKEYAGDSGRKQITIPMPPKEVEVDDEWPSVNDEIQFKPNPSVEMWVDATIQYQGDKFTILKSNTGREYSKRNSKLQMRKPKTPEEELRDELINDLSTMQRESNGYTVEALLSKYSITKKQ